MSEDSLALAKIQLYENNKMIAGTVSGEDGNFVFHNVNKGKYVMITSSIGHKNDTLVIKNLSKNINAGIIYLKPTSYELEGATVTSKTIASKEGIKYLYPPEAIKKNTVDVFGMLDKMNLSRLDVDVASKQINLNGKGSLKIYLNGREVKINEIRNLSPADIKRIEYHDIPEARYNNADVVLDFITHRAISGGNLYISLWQGLLKSFGEDNIETKVNKGKSQFSTGYYLAYRNWDRLWRENKERFYLPDKTILRTERGEPDKFKYDNHNFHSDYNYQNEKQILNVSLETDVDNQPHRDWTSNIDYQDNKTIYMSDKSNNKNVIPSLAIYYQQPISKNELLAFNLSGSHLDGKYRRLYMEEYDSKNITTLNTDADENQYAYRLSYLYEKKFNTGSFSAGIDYRQNNTSNTYNNIFNGETSDKKDKIHVRNAYLFVKYERQINKLYYRLGLGINGTWTKTDLKTYNYYTMQPSISIRYTPTDNFEARYFGAVSNVAPTLSNISPYSQAIDFIQIQKGNPNLKRQINYYNAIILDYDKNKMGTSIYLNHTYVASPIMEHSYLENNKIIRSIDNHKSFQNFNAELELRARPFGDYISIKAYVGSKFYPSNGNDYSHRKNFIYYGNKVTFYYKKLTLTWSMQQNTRNTFRGETLSKFEDGQMLSLSYNTGKYRIEADVLNMFSKKHINARENYSKAAPYSRYEYLDETKNLIRINVTINLSYGKRYNASSKRLNSNSTSETSILKGDK